MEQRKKWLRPGFRMKVLAPMISVMVVMLAVTVWFVDHRLNLKQQVEIDAQNTLATADIDIQHWRIQHLNSLRQQFSDLANEPERRSTFQTFDFDVIQKQLAAMLDAEGSNDDDLKFLLFTPANKYSVGTHTALIQKRNSSKSVNAFVMASALSVKNAMALDGEPDGVINDTVHINENFYNVVSFPIYTDGHVECGVLTFGEEMSWLAAQEFSRVANRPVVLVAGNHIVATTVPGTVPGDNYAPQFCAQFKQQSASGQSNIVSAKIPRLLVGAEHYFCASGHFPSLKGDQSIGYLLFSPYEPSLSVSQTQQLLLTVSLVTILIGSAIVWFLVNRATMPLRELRNSAEAVGRGDFTRRVPVRTHDEFGELARVFNQMTENLEESRSKLHQTVETLKNTQQQLIQSEKLSAVGEFVAGVAHELNNPLTAVMGFSEILKNTDMDPQHRRQLDMIHKAAQRCQKIVQSLLSFARRQPPERKPVSPNQLIEDVLEIVAYNLRTSNIEIIQQLDLNPPVVLADAHQVEQVLLNIINNARQAIELHQSAGWIKISTTATASALRISIQDSGPGIPEPNLKRIFDPFFTTKGIGFGTGLGLSLCYGIIKEHGGFITATSRPGEGATFTIELPVLHLSGDTTDLLRPPDAAAAKSNEGNGKKILVVDDEESLLQMIQDELARHGYQVTVTSNGETGLRRLKEESFDLILCDWKMPGLNGRQVYERLRTEHPALCQRIIFISGDVINEQRREFLEAEKRICLAKPFSLVELRQAVKETLAGN